MARGKKKETLTPEERLQAALVPESEQPYKVPGNWTWVKVGDLCTFIGGGTPDKTNPLYWNGNISWASVKDIKGSYLYSTIDKISQLGLESSSSNLCEAGDLLLVTRIEPAKTIVSKIVAAINQDLKIVKSELSSLFLYHYFCAFQHEFEKKASGSTVKGITLPNIQNTPFPLPPLPEQQRIVDGIESLFAKLDEAKQKAQDALDSFETRKAAILHRAFTGELTAQWRKEHGVGMESWENSTVGQVCHDVKVGIVIKPSQYYTDEEKGTPAFRSANVRENRIDDFDWVYLNHTGMENNSRSIVHTGDVLVVRSGNPGTACVVSEKFDGYNAIDILIAVPDHRKISSEFLCAYTNSPFGKKLIFENKRGMALAHFNVKGYSGLPIRVPQLNEQAKIICILDDLLAKEQQAKEAAEGVLGQIDLIKKAILARAFRGELGTNDPSEESAQELIKNFIFKM